MNFATHVEIFERSECSFELTVSPPEAIEVVKIHLASQGLMAEEAFLGDMRVKASANALTAALGGVATITEWYERPPVQSAEATTAL